MLAPTTMKNDHLVCSYDLTVNPLSFDFSCFLAISICESQRRGLKGKIFVVVMADGFRNTAVEGLYTTSYQKRRITNILIPLLSICTYCVGYIISSNIGNVQDYFNGSPNRLFFPEASNQFIQRRNNKIPQWLLTPMVPRQLEAYFANGFYPKDPIFEPSSDYVIHFMNQFASNTILLHPRCSPYNADRNTPSILFDEVSEKLEKHGFKVKVVQDIDQILGDKGPESETQLDAASFSIEIRLAAALAARTNITWSTGVVSPLYYSRASFYMFGFLREKGSISNTGFFSRKGPTPNKNPSWLHEGQVFDWRDADDLDSEYIVGNVLRQLY